MANIFYTVIIEKTERKINQKKIIGKKIKIFYLKEN